MTKDNQFLPDDYEVPTAEGGYMKFEQGENKFRIMCKPIMGYEHWVDTEDGKRKPVRSRMGEGIKVDEVEDPSNIKHFWAMVVWNYKVNRLQILEITQKGLQKAIRALVRDKAWGSPLGYDISIVREGEGLETEYNLIPSPPKPVDKEIAKAYKEASINLEALFDGDDPFVASSEDIDPMK